MPYFGKNDLKQHIHGKPIRFGYKISYLSTLCGHLVKTDHYQEASTYNSNPCLKTGGSVVADLIDKLPKDADY